MSNGITTLAKIGHRKELVFVNLTYDEIRQMYEQRAKRKYDSVGAFKRKKNINDNGGNGNGKSRSL